MEISAKRMRRSFSASILISSEKAIPSAVRFMPFKIERRNTHMPDCESRIHRKYKSDIASERIRLPTLLRKLIALESRTGKREVFKKSAFRWRSASSRYEIASGG